MPDNKDDTLWALTICQPYASLIALPDDHTDAKRVENRSWPTKHRGRLAIHAGKSRQWLEPDEVKPGFDESGFRIADLPFGAIVAIADVVFCVHMERTWEQWAKKYLYEYSPQLPPELEWVKSHRHMEGPYGFVLANVRPLSRPVECSGSQGLWIVKPDKRDAILSRDGRKDASHERPTASR